MLMSMAWCSANAQFTYTFSAAASTYTQVSAGGSDLNAIEVDDTHSASIPLGFAFGYAGTAVTSVKVNSNGWIAMDETDAPTAAQGRDNSNMASPHQNVRPAIMAFWDDLDGMGGTARYETTGSLGSRVFTMEWRNWQWDWQAAGTTITFQCKLYEGSNVIEFIYRQESGAISNTSGGASIGLLATASGSYYSLNSTGAAPTASTTTATVNLNTKPATGQLYRFTPTGCTGPTVTNTTSNSPICATGTLNLNSTATGTAPYSYVWSGTGTFNDASLVNPTVTGAATGTYSVTVKNWCGASANGSTSVTVNAAPTTSAAGPDQTICTTGATVTLAANTPTTGTGAWSQVSGTAATITSAGSPNTTVTGLTTAGARTFRWTISNAPCTASTDDVVITVNAPPTVANAGVDKTVCTTGGTTTMTANTATTGTGTWTQVSGPSTATITTASAPNTTITALTSVGTYVFQWTISNAPCTASSDQVNVVVTAPPVVTAGTYGPFCANDAMITLGGTPAGGVWMGTGVSGSGPYSFNPSVGTQTLTYTVTSGPCSPSSTTTITVNLAPGAPTLTTSSYAVCENGSVPNGQGLSATCPGIAQSTSTSFPGSNFISEGTTLTTRATLTMPALPAGAVVTAARLKLFNVVANTNIFGNAQRQNIRVALSGAFTMAEAQLTTATGAGTVSPNPVIALSGFPAAGGSINLRTRQTTDQFWTSPDATIASALIEVDYTIPTLVRWYDSPTSGTLVHTGSVLDPIGLNLVSNASASTTTFHATCGFNSCENIRLAATFHVNAPSDAGTNGAITLCSIDPAVDLFNSLDGTPQGGGTWSPGLTGGSLGTYTPGTSTPGTYTYTVNGTAPCPNVSATVTVTQNTAVNWYADTDGDGSGSGASTGLACSAPNTGDVSNNTDLCPTDANKVAPGQCGCGNLDTDTDSDGTADCNDLCPLDPGKTAPGACGCGVVDVATTYYADTDNDGFGEPGSPIGGYTCITPAGYVTNNSDNCPSVSGLIGSACSDNNPFTTGDVLNASCTCAGTPVPCDNWTLKVKADGNGNEITWQIIDANSPFVLASGGPYINNSTNTATVCIPQAASFKLKMMDAGGNGFPGGGWVLKDQTGRRIVDNEGNGGNFTSMCITGTAFTHEGTSGQVLIASHQDRENWVITDVIIASANSSVSAQWGIGNQSDDGYEFWFEDPCGGYSRRVFRDHANSGGNGPANAIRATKLKLSSMVTAPLPSVTLLNVRIRTRVNGVNGAWGPASRFKVDPNACTPTKLNDILGDPNFSCGATGKQVGGSGQTGKIYAKVVTSGGSAATNYRFKLAEPGEGYERIATSANAALVLSQWVTSPLLCGTHSYEVQVAASFDNGATYCPYGVTCTVEITNPFTQNCSSNFGGADADRAAITRGLAVSLYPNPNRGEQLFVSLSDLEMGVIEVHVDVYDSFGKFILRRTLPAQEGTLNGMIDLEKDLATGLYLVSFTAGQETRTERLMIQR